MSNVSSEPGQAKAFPPRGKQVPWGPTSAILVSALALFGGQVLAAILVSFIAGALNSGQVSQTWLNSISGQFYFVLVSDLLILAIIWLFMRSWKADWKLVGLARKPIWKDIGYALLGYLVYFGLLILTFSLANSLTHINLDQKQELGFDNLLGTGEKLMALVSLVLLPPFVEEVAFRGLLFTGLRKKMKFAVAAVITSLLFASLHLLESSQGLLWVAGMDTFVLSLVLCYLREKTGSLWAPIALHAVKNTIAFFVLIASASAL